MRRLAVTVSLAVVVLSACTGGDANTQAVSVTDTAPASAPLSDDTTPDVTPAAAPSTPPAPPQPDDGAACVPYTDDPFAAVASALNNGHQGTLDTLSGFDDPEIVQVDDDRSIWLVQDAYLDLDRDGGPLYTRSYLHNLLLDVTDTGTAVCFRPVFTLLDSGEPIDFERGSDRFEWVPLQSWLWPAAATVTNDRLAVWWIGMGKDDTAGEVSDHVDHGGIRRSPRDVWYAEYDLDTLDRTLWRPASDPGIAPVFPTSIVNTGDGWLYLYGNSMLRNLRLEGGIAAAPAGCPTPEIAGNHVGLPEQVPAGCGHSATRTYLARVPADRPNTAPDYWCGDDSWCDDRSRIVPILEAGWTEAIIDVRHTDGGLAAVTKLDGWWGSRIVTWHADRPEGPWTATSDTEYVPSLGHDPATPYRLGTFQNSYSPEWWQDRIVISQNAWQWIDAVEQADTRPFYWPAVISPGG